MGESDNKKAPPVRERLKRVMRAISSFYKSEM